MQSKFKQKFPMLRDRRNESERVRLRYPDRIPVIAEVAERSTRAIPQMRRNKFLVPKDLSAGQFIFTLRRPLNLKATVAIFLYVCHPIYMRGNYCRLLMFQTREHLYR